MRIASDGEHAAELLASLPAGERAALVDPRFVGHQHSLRLVLADPRFPASAVSGAVVADPSRRSALLGALRGTLRPEAAPSAPRAPDRASAGPPRDGAPRHSAPHPDAAAAAMEVAGVPVHRPDLGVLVARVPADGTQRDEALRAVAAVDEEAVRLRTAVKPRDGFFTTHCVSPYSRHLARWCARRGLTPNQVTTASLLTALIAAGCAATGTRGGFVAAGALLLASFVLDCADGQLARYALKYSTLGAWLDATFDRAKEYAYYAGLALGAARGGDDVWALALGAMVLQTVRHMVDFAFNESHRPALAANASSRAATSLSGRLDSVAWTVWARRMVVLPIGERWALIAVLTAFTTPRTTFVVLLAGCALAACYTTAGRLLRSARGAAAEPAAGRSLAELADSGPLAAGAARLLPGGAAPAAAAAGAALVLATAAWAPAGSWWPVLAATGYALLSGWAVAGHLTGPFDWLVPPILRTAEYSAVLILAARAEMNGVLPAAFGLVAAVAYHHYDTVYRIRGGTGAPPRSLVFAIGGHEGRVLVVTVLAAAWLGAASLTIALAALAGLLACAVLVESIRFWVSSQAPAVHDETGEPA